MKGNFVDRPEPLRPDEVAWQDTKHLTDEEGRLWVCLPLGCEHQMFTIVNCHECGRPTQWIGVGSPFGDGQQYLLQYEAWCYWCFPRENFTEEELRFVRQAEWARQQTKAEIIDFIRRRADWFDDGMVNPSKVESDIDRLI